MKTSPQAVDFIKSFEDFRAKPYLPTVHDVPTIGFGTTVYPTGAHVQLSDPPVTEVRAITYLMHDLIKCEDAVHELVTVPLKQGQFDALVSFVYNLGEPALEASTLLKRLNARNYPAAADEFLRWNRQKGTVLAGLTRRRQGEREMFLK